MKDGNKFIIISLVIFEKLSEEDQRDLTYGLYKTNKILSKMLNND